MDDVRVHHHTHKIPLLDSALSCKFISPLQKPFCHDPPEYNHLLYQVFVSTFSASVFMYCFLQSYVQFSSPIAPYHPSKSLTKAHILRPPLGHPQFCPTFLHFLCLGPVLSSAYFSDFLIQHDVPMYQAVRRYKYLWMFNGLHDVTNRYLQFISFSENKQLGYLRVTKGRLSFCKIL